MQEAPIEAGGTSTPMTKEEMAARLNGREYREEITKEEEALARAAGLVVIFGASDDLCELRGAIHDEVGCIDGGDILLVDGGVWDDEECDCKHAERANRDAKRRGQLIVAGWDRGEGYSWTFRTEIPHATFDVMEGDEKYCRGIVFELPR